MVLPLFPENGLANSVIPPVLAGLGFSVFFAETLGWNFSGLIVPGYLAPILVVRPFSGLVIIAEALITYIILRILADGFSRMGIWTRFFGQDAFFALLCISILVKCTVEGPLQPVIGSVLSQIIPGDFDFRNELHSTGLIIVPLMANIFWRHGLRKNLLPTLLNIFLTFAFLKFILIPYTNFSVNKFELMYSKMAINFEESARFYVILLLGAAMATHKKYKYGWSYHGMLIPALLGIAWLTPLKILTTFFEAFLILIIGVTLVKSRLMRNLTMEGPRKLLLLFSIGFALKMIAGFALQETVPGFSAMEIYGFAYILPALLAIEMWPGRKVIQVSRVTLQTSFLAALLGVGICTSLQAIDPDTFNFASKEVEEIVDETNDQIRIRRVSDSISTWLMDLMETRLEWGVYHNGLAISSLERIDKTVLKPIIQKLRNGVLDDPGVQNEMNETLRSKGFELVILTDPSDNQTYWILNEVPPIHYRGVYVFRTGITQPVTVQVAQPKSEFGTLPIGIKLFRSQNARALLISGTSRRRQFSEFDITHLDNRRNLFQLVHQVFHREFIDSDPMLSIQVRGAEDLRATGADLVISTSRELRQGSSHSNRLTNLREELLRSGIETRFFRGDRTDMHLSTHSNAQQAYVETFNMGEFAVLWFDSKFRDCFGTTAVSDTLLQRLNWHVSDGNLADVLLSKGTDIGISDLETEVLITKIQKELDDYNRTRNVIHLDRLTVFAQDEGYSITQFKDTPSSDYFLVLTPEHSLTQPVLVFNYSSHSSRVLTINPRPVSAIRSDIERFSLCRYGTLVLSGETS